MIKKIWLKKVCGFLLLLIVLNAIVFWISLTFNSISIWLNKLDIHFSWPGNAFIWSMLISQIVDLPSPQKITLDWKSIECTKQILWLYFNSQRWNRLRPLDQSGFNQLKEISSTYNDLTEFKWWLYTNCTGTEIDASSIFGFVKHTWWWNDYYIVAWTKTDYDQNKYSAGFSNSFQRFDVSQWILLLWFIWDNYWWIWLVWWPSEMQYWTNNLINFLNGTWSIKTAFTYSWNSVTSNNLSMVNGWKFLNEYLDFGGTNLFWNLFVRWNVWLSKSYQDKSSLTTTTQSEALLFNLSDVNVSTLVNTARKNTSALCRDKWNVTSSSDVLCYKNTNLNINLSDDSTYWKKTIILNSGNVILKNSMKANSMPFELFIDKWNMYLEDPAVSDLATFDQNWYANTSATNFSAKYLKWVFIINWLIIWSWTSYWNIFPHKLVVQWRITSLNSPSPTEKRKQQVENLLWSSYGDLVDLSKTFVWSCSFWWTGSDNTRCEWTWDAVTKAFVIIDSLDKWMKYKLLNY